MHEVELGYKPRIFTFLTIWQDIGEPSKMLSDGFVCVLGRGGAVTGSLSSSLSLLLSSKCQYRPSILGTTADFYRFPNVGLNSGMGSEDLGSLSVTEEVNVWGWHFAVLRGGGWAVESAADPLPRPPQNC